MTSTDNTKISSGPSKFDLMVSLFEGNQNPRKTVRFKVDSGQRKPRGPRNTDEIIYNDVDVAITLIAHEDGSGESWLFEGYIHGISRGNIHGYYSTKNRSGWYARGAKYTVFGLSK